MKNGYWLAAAALLVVAGLVSTPVSAQELPTQVRAVYALGNTNGVPNFPLNVFIPWEGELFEADTLWIPARSDGYPVGLAVDSNNAKLYIAYVNSNVLDVLDARDLESLDAFTVPDADELAGMDIDDLNGLFYISNRESNEMWVYDVDTLVDLDSWEISAGLGAFGIAVMDDTLYVGAGTGTVPYFNVNSHDQIGSFTISDPALAIDVWETDPPAVFTTSGLLNNRLTRYDLATGTETQHDLGATAKGLVVDSGRGYVYQLTGSGVLPGTGVRVVDAASMEELSSVDLGNGTWSPTDIKTGTNDFGYRVSARVLDDDDRLFAPGEEMTVEVTVRNLDENPIALLPLEVYFSNQFLEPVSSDPPADEGKADKHDEGVHYADLTETFGEDLEPGASFTLTATFQTRLPEGCINAAPSMVVPLMKGAFDDEDTLLPRAAGNASFAITCPCQNDADCDTGEFCAGAGTCDDNGQCVYAGSPCEDGDLCDEEADECVTPPGDDDEGDDDIAADDDDDDSGDAACGC